ncbi:MAG: hypothetical protein AAF564_14905 [Bacteroidota bacterium]
MDCKLFFCAVLLLLCTMPAFAQTFPRIVAISDRIGESIDVSEQVYFNLFPSDRPFNGATVQQLTDSTFTITIDRGDRNEFFDLDLDRFYALRKYINEFEIRYTGKLSTNWDYIIFYTDPLRQPFGPGTLYELTLTSGEQKSGHVVWANEQGVYLSQMISARSPELTASRLSYYPRQALLRIAPKKRLFESFAQGPDIVFAGEPATYTNLALPQLLQGALYPRQLPPELTARAARNKLIPAEPLPDPEWRNFRFPNKSSSAQFLIYLPSIKYFAPPGFNEIESEISFAGNPENLVKPSISAKPALLFAAARLSVSPRMRIGLSLSQSLPNNTKEVANIQLEGAQAVERARSFRSNQGSLTVGGTYLGFDLTYLLRATPDYLTYDTAQSRRRLLDYDVNLIIGPSIGVTSTVADLVSVGRVRTGDGATFTSNTVYGVADKTRKLLAGGHFALEVTAFLNRSISVGILFDSALYFNYSVPELALIDFFENEEKVIRGPQNNKLWLSTFFFGLSYHL